MDMDSVIGTTLRIGVIISIVLISAGVAIMLARGEGLGYSINEISSMRSPVNSSVIPVLSAVGHAASLDGLSLIVLGLVVLIATPVLRVLLGIASFVMEKDWLYAVITIIVFIDLMIAIFIIPALLK
ncbi:DUF1634 domain-containing protein [Thermocladium modestius]|nr:DUF1634 domain-containing protein [Thermocladium modestius]